MTATQSATSTSVSAGPSAESGGRSTPVAMRLRRTVANGSSNKSGSPMAAAAMPTLYGLPRRAIGLPIRCEVSDVSAT